MLSDQERRLLKPIGEGLTDRRIGERMFPAGKPRDGVPGSPAQGQIVGDERDFRP
ncbi:MULTISPECIES: hypothetical protein [unclassified Streptosporangium]|uniref:hypothetical protein n=1 Tax=unclassified Streptosporangium TaxID=2632669 RepID=UPI002E2AB0B5|nr:MULTISPECIES: hypothetical protein [unclassified Streptosporangium]